MAATGTIRPLETCLDWCIKLLRYITPPENTNASSVERVMDMLEKCLKEEMRQQGGSKPPS